MYSVVGNNIDSSYMVSIRPLWHSVLISPPQPGLFLSGRLEFLKKGEFSLSARRFAQFAPNIHQFQIPTPPQSCRSGTNRESQG